jgi:hypothetical protein
LPASETVTVSGALVEPTFVLAKASGAACTRLIS